MKVLVKFLDVPPNSNFVLITFIDNRAEME